MKTQPSLTPGILLALLSQSAIEAVDWMLVFYPAHTQEDRKERTLVWEFSAVDQNWHPQEIESLESALQTYADLVQIQAAEIRRLWGTQPSKNEQSGGER